MSRLDLEKVEHYSLFAFYHPLLTDKQQKYFREYFFNDLSLQEIADLLKVSRNAVYDSLLKTMKLLADYEKKLKLYKKYQARKKIYDKHSDCQFISKLQEIDEI
ncbi:MAG: YlxM family DNA-binding protein [Spiroplasma sp.]